MTVDKKKPTNRKPSFLYRSHKLLTIAIAVLILAYAPWARPLQKWLRTALGAAGMKYLMAGFFFLGGGILVLSARLWRLPARNLLLPGVVFAAGLFYSFFLPLPEERIHLMQFGALGLLAYPSFKGNQTSRWRAVWLPFLFVFLVGVADEVFQWFLPDRVGDLRDVFFNAMGGAWGIVLYLTASVKGDQG